MNILVVDDNKNNRLILKLLLEDYMDENENVVLHIEEAEDGLIAVNKCIQTEFDIILMDIMMPNMDGIEATKIIRKTHPKIMIIAVSAVDDSERKKLILNNGAEDYISKPINSDIFISRMNNYIILCEARRYKKTSTEYAANLYTSEVFSRHTRFLITSEDSLSEFWEYYLLSNDIKSDNLSDIIRTVFAIAEIQQRLSIKSDIFVEESEEKRYFTLTKIDEIPQKIIELTLRKNNFKGLYKVEGARITFVFNMIEMQEDISLEEENVVLQNIEIIPEVIIPEVTVEEEPPIIFEENTSVVINSSVALQVFDYMDSEDLDDLEEYANKLSSIMLIVGGGDVTEEEVLEIHTYLEKLASILSTYSEVYVISKALASLSVDMASHAEVFIENSKDLGPMCKAFSNDMSNWIEQSFHTGAPSATFMNDTIDVNCKTIISMLSINDVVEDTASDDFDDIFDF